MADDRQAAEPSGTSTGEDPNKPQPVDDADELNDQIVAFLTDRVDKSKSQRKDLIPRWRSNVERRTGHVPQAYSSSVRGADSDDEGRAEITPDWSLTKTKTANLYSQLPTVMLTHENVKYGPALNPFAKSLNYELSEKRAHTAVAMDEVLSDVVNASGIGAVIVGYAARFAPKKVAVEESIPDPRTQQPVPTSQFNDQQLEQLAGAGLLHLKEVQTAVSDKFYVSRISPAYLITPPEFLGSCFDDGDLIGYSGLASWAEAKNEFELDDKDKDELLNAEQEQRSSENLRAEGDRSKVMTNLKVIHYDRIYYWRHRFDPEEKHFECIWEAVFLAGKKKPVLHRQWTGQRLDPQSNRYVGALKFPVRVLTLTYISDNPIPPSDTEMGRAQVDDMRRSRRHMFESRERSIPMRWFDVNRVDPEIQSLLMAGTWQGMIPTNGDGGRTFGEVARASYPAEDFSFDNMAKADLMETWHIGPNQQGTGMGPKQTKAQVDNVQQNFATVIGQERARVMAFFTGICEVLAGLVALYSDFPILDDKEREAMKQAWDRQHILHELAFRIRPDSTILMEAPARLARLSQFLNLTVKSGFVNPMPIIIEMAELSGLNPDEVIVKPQPKGPEEPNVSVRVSGKDDVMNTGVMALLAQLNRLPKPEHVKAAKQFLKATQTSLEQDEQDEKDQQAQSPAGAPPAGAGGPSAPPPPGADGQPATPPEAHSGWSLGSKIMKRSRDANG